MSSTLSEDYETQFNRWRDDAEEADLVELIRGRGHKLSKAGREWVGPCPRCGGHDRFSINPQARVFNCRGFGGGGYIDAVMHIDACTFLEACETMTGRPAPAKPGRKRKASPASREETAPPPAQAEEGSDFRSADTPAESDPLRGAKRTFVELFDGAQVIAGTPVETYLAGRGLAPAPGWTFDLRYVDALPYMGFASPDDRDHSFLGKFPAMLAAIRNGSGDLIGVHRTYLDPNGRGKLAPPGDRKRNSAKKIVGRVLGGLIWLSPRRSGLLTGEGIETTRSGYLLGIGGGDVGYAASVTLGNMAGAPTGNIQHPTIPKRSVPNGDPDPERPGFEPPGETEEIYFLGDGDSDGPFTLAQLLLAGRRHRSAGRQVFFAMAPAGKDWNDVLMERGGSE